METTLNLATIDDNGNLPPRIFVLTIAMLGRIDKYGTGSRRRSIPSAYEAYPTARLRATCRRGVSWVRAKSGGQGALATCLEYRYSTPVLWKPTTASQGSKKSAVRERGVAVGKYLA